MDILTAITELRRIELEKRTSNRLNLPNPINVNIGSPWGLQGDFLIVGDVHVPTFDKELAGMVARIGEKYLKRPRRLIIAGDLFNMDKYSVYPHITIPPTWGEERQSAEELLSEWLNVFDEAYWFVGNHERRLQRLLVEVLETTDLMSVIISDPNRAHFSNFSYCLVDTPGGRYSITHPKNYSRNQLTVANSLARKYKTHIISFHEHHVAKGWDDSGEYILVNGGSLIDVSRVAYMSLDMNTTPYSLPGFVLLKNGCPYLFGAAPLTDWGMWLK